MSVYDHVSDHDLERLFLGLIASHQEQDQIRAHISICHLCTVKAEWTEDYVRKMADQLRLLHSTNGDTELG